LDSSTLYNIFISPMVFASVQRVGLLVAQITADGLVRGCHNIVDYFHVPDVNNSAVGQIGGGHTNEGIQQNDPPPANFDVFENPCFVSTEYKDDRAAMNLIKTASHASTLAHAKRCDCKPCRDRRPAFHKRGTGRRYGYQGTPIRTRTAAVGLAALSQSASTHETPSRNIVRKSQGSESQGSESQGSESQGSESQNSETFSESPMQEARLRGGDLQLWRAVCDRLSDFEAEKPHDDAHNEQDGGEHWTGNHSTLPPIEILTLHPEEPSASHLLAPLAASLEGQTDDDDGADSDSDIDNNDHEDIANTILPSTAHLPLTTTRTIRRMSKSRLPPWPLNLYQHEAFRRFTAIAPDTPHHQPSKEMPWEWEVEEEEEDE
jgi:hypothetical protein